MAHATTSVTSTPIRIGLCGVTLPAGTPPLRTLEAPSLGGWFAAYDTNRMTEDDALAYLRGIIGPHLDIVRAAEGGA